MTSRTRPFGTFSTWNARRKPRARTLAPLFASLTICAASASVTESSKPTIRRSGAYSAARCARFPVKTFGSCAYADDAQAASTSAAGMLQAHFMEWPPFSLDVCPRENPPACATEGEPERHPGKNERGRAYSSRRLIGWCFFCTRRRACDRPHTVRVGARAALTSHRASAIREEVLQRIGESRPVG